MNTTAAGAGEAMAPGEARARLEAVAALCRDSALYVHIRHPDLGLPPEAVVRVSSVLAIAGEPVEATP